MGLRYFICSMPLRRRRYRFLSLSPCSLAMSNWVNCFNVRYAIGWKAIGLLTVNWCLTTVIQKKLLFTGYLRQWLQQQRMASLFLYILYVMYVCIICIWHWNTVSREPWRITARRNGFPYLIWYMLTLLTLGSPDLVQDHPVFTWSGAESPWDLLIWSLITLSFPDLLQDHPAYTGLPWSGAGSPWSPCAPLIWCTLSLGSKSMCALLHYQDLVTVAAPLGLIFAELLGFSC